MSSTGLSRDEVFDLLSNARRRFVINYLLREDRPVGIQELSRELAAWEFEVDPEELTDKQEKRIYVALYQTHVPKLEEMGVVEYDPDTSLVQLTDAVQHLQPYVEAESDDRRPWPWLYLAVTGLGVALLAGVQLGTLPAFVTPLLVSGVTLAALLALGGYHYTQVRG